MRAMFLELMFLMMSSPESVIWVLMDVDPSRWNFRRSPSLRRNLKSFLRAAREVGRRFGSRKGLMTVTLIPIRVREVFQLSLEAMWPGRKDTSKGRSSGRPLTTPVGSQRTIEGESISLTLGRIVLSWVRRQSRILLCMGVLLNLVHLKA